MLGPQGPDMLTREHLLEVKRAAVREGLMMHMHVAQGHRETEQLLKRYGQRSPAFLDEAGILTRVRQGRRNSYYIDTNAHLRHPIEESCTVGELLKLVLSPARVRKLEANKEAFDEQHGSQQP
jgi:hypothetical protein